LTTLCASFEAMKRTEPGPTRVVLPFWKASSVPSRITMLSSFGWVWGAWVVWPAGSQVTCICSRSSVGVGRRRNSRERPLAPVGRAWISSHVIANDPWVGSSASASGAPIVNAATRALQCLVISWTSG
jgi:hypothetical protein